MGDEFLSNSSTQSKTYTEIFDENFPFYLAIGMSFAEYWEGDCKLTQYYRKAYQIKQESINNNAWLQGLYIYDAFQTVMHNAFSEKGAEPKSYPKEPYNLKNEEKSQAEKDREIEAEQIKAKAWMESLVRTNKSQSHRA